MRILVRHFTPLQGCCCAGARELIRPRWGIVTFSGLAAGSVAGETGSMKTPADPYYCRRLAAPRVQAELAGCCVASGRTRRCRFLRDRPAMMQEIRPDILKTGNAGASPGQDTNGTSTRCSSGSEVCTICGALWIRTASCSTSSFSRGGMPRLQCVLCDFREVRTPGAKPKFSLALI
jgi:hypothetical protein